MEEEVHYLSEVMSAANKHGLIPIGLVTMYPQHYQTQASTEREKHVTHSARISPVRESQLSQVPRLGLDVTCNTSLAPINGVGNCRILVGRIVYKELTHRSKKKRGPHPLIPYHHLVEQKQEVPPSCSPISPPTTTLRNKVSSFSLSSLQQEQTEQNPPLCSSPLSSSPLTLWYLCDRVISCNHISFIFYLLCVNV